MDKDKKEQERFFIGDKVCFDIYDATDGVQDIFKGFGLIIMSGEERTPGIKEGEDGDWSHDIKQVVRFKDMDNLNDIKAALGIIERALVRDAELE